MTEWRHVLVYMNDHLIQGPICPTCGCSTPTPDPSSPCSKPLDFDGPCGLDATAHDGVVWVHPHQTTRCTCGHPIERS